MAVTSRQMLMHPSIGQLCMAVTSRQILMHPSIGQLCMLQVPSIAACISRGQHAANMIFCPSQVTITFDACACNSQDWIKSLTLLQVSGRYLKC